MEVSYKKLFKLLIDRDMKKKDLQEATGLSSSSITKLAKDEHVSLDVIIKVCEALSVDIGEIWRLFLLVTMQKFNRNNCSYLLLM